MAEKAIRRTIDVAMRHYGGVTRSPNFNASATTPRHVARRIATDDKIADAVFAILREVGPHAVTIESVAARSGVAKTSIYRRYSDRAALLTGVLDQVAPPHPDEAGVPSRSRLTEYLRMRQAAFEDRLGFAAVGRLLTAHDATVAEWRQSVFLPRISAMRAFFDRGVEAGILRDGLDYDLLTELLSGGMLMSDILHGDVPDDWADRIVSLLWPMISTEAGT